MPKTVPASTELSLQRPDKHCLSSRRCASLSHTYISITSRGVWERPKLSDDLIPPFPHKPVSDFYVFIFNRSDFTFPSKLPASMVTAILSSPINPYGLLISGQVM